MGNLSFGAYWKLLLWWLFSVIWSFHYEAYLINSADHQWKSLDGSPESAQNTIVTSSTDRNQLLIRYGWLERNVLVAVLYNIVAKTVKFFLG